MIGQSFWPSTVAALQKVAPGLRRGLLIVERSEDLLATCAELGVMTCNPSGTLLLEQPGLVAELHDAGLEVMVWTLNEPEQWALALEIGVDAVITDRPDRLRGGSRALTSGRSAALRPPRVTRCPRSRDPGHLLTSGLTGGPHRRA
ncbi:glycerophosphodiester phosphodiesterase family protein [Oerskovia sp. M15]